MFPSHDQVGKGIKSTRTLIENLTNDEDQRQQLWLHYVSGGSIDTFEQKLEQITREQELHEKLQLAIAEIYQRPLSPTFVDFLDNFSDFERSIMFLLLLGLSVEEVSKYKGISEVRIKQSLVAIKKHTIWEKEHGIKEKL